MTTEYKWNLVRLRIVDEERGGKMVGRTVGMTDRGAKINFDPHRGVADRLYEMQHGNMLHLVGLAISQVSRLLFRVDVPDHVVGQTNDLVAGTLGHLGEALGLGLILESVGGEVDTCTR